MAQCSSPSKCGSAPACSGCASNPAQRKAVAVKVTALTKALERIRHVIFVMSGKGGVGKSAVAANLAVALANRGKRVGILDVDMHGPSIPSLFGLDSRLTPKDSETIAPLYYREKIAVISMDSLLDDRDMAIIWRGPRKTAAINQFIAGVAWGDLDYLLIDSPPGTGDEHLAVLQAISGAQALVVTTPQEISLADVRKALHFLERMNAPILGMVENMSGLSCPHCGGSIDLFSSGGGEALARNRNIPFLGRIPIDPAMLVAADRKEPVVDCRDDTPAKAAFLNVADEVYRLLPA